MILALTGKARSGKNTVGDYLTRTRGFKQLGWADKLKEAALALDPVVCFIPGYYGRTEFDGGGTDFWLNAGDRLSLVVQCYGWEDAKKVPEVRRTLQRFGTEVGRNLFGENFWVDQAFRTIEKLEEEGAKLFAINDTRFDNEATEVQKKNGYVIEVRSNRETDIGENGNHASEKGLSEHITRFVIQNDGTFEELYKRVDEVMEEIDKLEEIRSTRNMSEVNMVFGGCEGCGAYYGHSPLCENQPPEEQLAKLKQNCIYLNKRLNEERTSYQLYRTRLKGEVEKWQGKFRTVKHENNKLRNKLYENNKQRTDS
jgi:hypothetical protein